MTFSTSKRFIAGAVCPKCGLMDKVMAFSEAGVDYRECISCGFRDQQRLNSAPRELPTRVNEAGKVKPDDTRPVKLIDP